mmetsp:Transcript_25108/g.36053  ORF Transcript_25108/g.36053 Transcript_25108/m.36053 type:complete len:373 (-) Transcript_25108:407-1525(-)
MNEKILVSGDSHQLPTIFYVISWMAHGISMILFNKVLLTTWGFKFPFFLTMWHMIFASILTQILSRTTNLLPSVKEGRVSQADYFRKFVPMSFLFAASLVLGNSAYKFISVAFIQMLKSSTPVIVLILTFIVGREKPSIAQLGIMMIISIGVMLSTVGEVKFNMLGFIIQFTGVFCECSRCLIMDLLLSNKKIDSLSMLYYMAPISSLTLFAGFLYFEFFQFLTVTLSPSLLLALFLNGCLSFSLNMAVILLVGNASVVVMSVCGPLKDILLVLLSVLLFQTPITLTQVVGYNISVLGLCLFREFKNTNNKAILVNLHVNLYKITQFKSIGMWKSTPSSTLATNLSLYNGIDTSEVDDHIGTKDIEESNPGK